MTQETTGWRPIETPPGAPMAVLFYSAGVRFWTRDHRAIQPDPMRGEATNVGYWDGRAWVWSMSNHPVFEAEKPGHPDMPTHWMPLPEPPVPTDPKTTLAALTPAALAALLHERTGGAWKAVPVEATLDMLIEATEEWTCIRAYEDRAAAIWRAMLAAAPAPEPPK